MFLINSRLDLFTAASTRVWRPFSRSYRSILPSSLAMNLSSTLEFSSQLPVSVYGTGSYKLKLRGFSWKFLAALSTHPKSCGTITLQLGLRICLQSLIPTCFNELFRQLAAGSLLRHPIAFIRSTGILTCCPSTTPFGFALGPD